MFSLSSVNNPSNWLILIVNDPAKEDLNPNATTSVVSKGNGLPWIVNSSLSINEVKEVAKSLIYLPSIPGSIPKVAVSI